MCLYHSSVGVRRSSVTWADDSTSVFYGHTETATAPSTNIAEFFQQYENIALFFLAIRRYVYLIISMPACIHGNAIPQPCRSVKILVTKGTKRDTATTVFTFSMFEPTSALPQS